MFRLSRSAEFVVVLALLAGLTGCSSSIPGPAFQSQGHVLSARRVDRDTSLYPTPVGRSWHYALHTLNNGELGPERALRMQIVRADQGVMGRTAVMERFYQESPVAPTRVVTAADRIELSRLSDPAPPEGASLVILRLPPVQGLTWLGRPLPPGNQEKVTIENWERVSVPAGEYRALHVCHHLSYSNGETDALDYWYAPGIGCVRMVETLTIYIGGVPRKLAAEGRLLRVDSTVADSLAATESSSVLRNSSSPGLIPVEAFAEKF